MSILEFMYNVFCIVSIIDLIIQYIKLSQSALLLALGAQIKTSVEFKLLLDKILIISYIAYWVYKILVWKGVI